MRKRCFWCISAGSLLLSVYLGFATAEIASAGTPTEELSAMIERAQEVLNNRALSEAEQKRQVKKIAYAQFDFPEMSKRVLARHWSKITPPQQQEFVAMFTELLERIYFNRIKLIQGARFSYVSESVTDDFATVRSKTTIAKSGELNIDYRLRLTDGVWKIYDISVEDLSLVSNYRAQFNHILAKSTFEELLQRMREKTQ